MTTPQTPAETAETPLKFTASRIRTERRDALESCFKAVSPAGCKEVKPVYVVLFFLLLPFMVLSECVKKNK
jgi:hypothetical protein